MPKTNAEYCRDYRKRKTENKIKKTARSSTERVREFRARREASLNVENKSSITHNHFIVQNSESDHNDIPMDISNVQGDALIENDIVNNDFFKMGKTNAEHCKNYYNRKKAAKEAEKIRQGLPLKKPRKRTTGAERTRACRLRKLMLSQINESSVTEISSIPSTSNSRITTLEPSFQLATTTASTNRPDISTVSSTGIADHDGVKVTIKIKMEDVKVQADSNEKIVKTNTTEICNENVRNEKSNELDKFKRRMIRAIARLLYTENKAEADIWDDLKTETGCDCELLWSRMRALTIKKLYRLFTAEDKINNITKIVQLSVTDWLLYDLVLVHEKVDVIGQELDNKEEPAFLRDLFNLVEEFNIENATKEELCEKWFEATAKYNNTGKRQCSPMLLQKRWYQLKELSRSNFYNFWFIYRGDSRKLERANEFKPSDLQLDIVKRYKEIVTKPFLSWEVLVKERRVALPADFESLRLARNKISISENEPDLEVIEQQVETIDLEEINDSSDSVGKNTDNNEEFNDFNIDIVKIESLAEQDDDVSVLESVHIPLEQSDSGEMNNSDVDVENTKSPDDNDLEIIESDSEQIMPKIASVTSTAYLESDKNRPEKLSPKDIIDIEHYETQTQSVDAVNTILDQIVRKVVENKIITNLDEKNDTTSKEKVLKIDNNRKELSSNLIIDLDKEEIKKINIQDNFKTLTNTRENCEQSSNIDFDDFSNNYNFIDDGIEFVDDGIEYMDEDYTQTYKVKPEIKSEIIEETNEEEPKIDLKLLLTPVVYTKKLDDMDVFRFIDYNTVKDDRVLQNAARESKPEDANSIDMKKMFQEYNHDESGNVEADDGDIIPDYDIAISSWLFRKPKVDNYNPIQLCKNPDFNTRLKRLAAAFYTSERNRLLLKQCKPLTVDLHKTFESQLINNTLYLKNTKKNSDIDITFNEMIATSYKTELPKIMEPSIHNEIAAEQQISIEQTSETHTERNKVINLPDKEQIRRVNQRLLVAEVSPIQVSNPVNESNIKPEYNVSNTDEPRTPHVSSMATNEDTIKSLSNVSEFSFETDKVTAVSESDNSKLTDAINVDNEQSETLSSKYTIMHNPKNYKWHNLNSWFKQPVPRYRTKTGYKKYMELSWLPKPQPNRTDAIDCLLAADTVERILSLCKDDYISSDPKVLKPKRKRVKNKNITLNQIPAVRKINTIKEKKTEKKKHTSKKSKCRISITTQTTNIKNVCCWSRQKIENFYKLNTGKHFCLHNRCVCCCKADLEAKLLDMEQQRKRCDPIILSDDESIAITAGKKHSISKVTIGTNTDYDKDFEDQFAANLNTLNDNSNQFITPIISIPLGDLLQTESGCQTQMPNIIKKPLPPSTLDNEITAVTSIHKNKPKVPISLGKNKILLCSFKPTTAKATFKKIKKDNQNSQPEQVLPEGCHLVLLPNRELALSIDPGVELDANELSKLPSLIAAVQKQINFIPTSENNLDPYKVALNEETVIHLSDDENSTIKDNPKDNLNINDSNTSNSSPTAMNLGSSNENIVTDVGAITKEENQIPSSDSNSLSSPNETCNIPGLVTTNSSIIKNIDVILESSTNEINSKDNTSEVIDNSTNNTEDVTGVNKKTILSDLMEMSGISTDDITVSNNNGNGAGNDGSVSNIGSATNDESISIIHPVLSQVDSSTSDLQREYINITRSVGINSLTNNIIIRAALLRCPELNVVSSFPELKYAYENGAQFFKMDVVNGIIVPINICIKQDLEGVRMLRRKGISKVLKSVIDLTEDSDIPTHSSNIQPIQQKMPIHTPNEIFDETAQDIQPNKNNSAIKPIKEFKAIHPSILRYSGRSLLVRPIKNSTMSQNKIIGVTKHKRKQELYVQNIDLDEDNKLKSQNNPSNRIDSDAESDEEPPNEIFDETAQDIQPNKNNNAIKPIKMFKAIHPSILRYSGRSLLVRPIKNSTMIQNKIIGVTKHKRKQELYVQNIDLDEDNELKAQDNPSNRIDSDAESDEEPLAKKAKRLRNNLDGENKNNDPSLDIDSDMNCKGSATMDINIEIPSQFQPIVFEDNNSQSSDDDCILGV